MKLRSELKGLLAGLRAREASALPALLDWLADSGEDRLAGVLRRRWFEGMRLGARDFPRAALELEQHFQAVATLPRLRELRTLLAIARHGAPGNDPTFILNVLALRRLARLDGEDDIDWTDRVAVSLRGALRSLRLCGLLVRPGEETLDVLHPERIDIVEPGQGSDEAVRANVRGREDLSLVLRTILPRHVLQTGGVPVVYLTPRLQADEP